MFKIVFHKEKILPDINEYLKVLLFSAGMYFFLREFIFNLFPLLETIDGFFSFFIITAIIIYLAEIIDIKFLGKKVFGNGN